MDKLVLYDSAQYKKVIQAIPSPSKRINMVQRIENMEYKRYIREQAELYFYFISYYWSLLGLPVGYVISQVIFIVGVKGTPGATAAILTTATAATSNVAIEGANAFLWGAHKTYTFFFKSSTYESPRFEKYDLHKVAGNTVDGISNIIDTIIPDSMKLTTVLGMMVFCTYLHYIIIDWINRSRFHIKQSVV